MDHSTTRASMSTTASAGVIGSGSLRALGASEVHSVAGCERGAPEGRNETGRSTLPAAWQQSCALPFRAPKVDTGDVPRNATSEIYQAQLVEEESTRTMIAGLRIDEPALLAPCTAIGSSTGHC